MLFSAWREYFAEAFRVGGQKALLSNMLICALATASPVIMGEISGSVIAAIYGALFGYLMTLVEPFGNIGRRIFINIACFMLLMFGVVAGTIVQPYIMLFCILIFIGSYFLGLWGGSGEDVERCFLNFFILFIAAFYINHAGLDMIWLASSYGLLVLVGVIFALLVQYYLHQRNNIPLAQAAKSIVENLKFPFKRGAREHIHAFVYAFMALVTILFVDYFNLARGYWVVIIYLILMKHSKKTSFYRILQRFVGTVAAVVVVELLMLFVHKVNLIIFIVGLFAFLSPLMAKKNYWLLTFVVSVLVLLLLDLAWVETGNFILPFIRLRATFYGCFFAAVSVFLVVVLERLLLPAAEIDDNRL